MTKINKIMNTIRIIWTNNRCNKIERFSNKLWISLIINLIKICLFNSKRINRKVSRKKENITVSNMIKIKFKIKINKK